MGEIDMNYLAHLLLSGDSDEILVGNLIGDFIKGTISENFPGQIGAGIMLHRQIDSFTDAHPIMMRGRKRFSPERRRYAGIILDICFDHFLIHHWSHFANMGLPFFVDGVHRRIQPYNRILKGRLHFFLSRENIGYLLETNQDLDGVDFSLSRISKRMKNGTALIDAIDEIKLHYDLLEADFFAFFPELVNYVYSVQEQL
ncbi:MAG: ACP phosphodiesterase [bacterium]